MCAGGWLSPGGVAARESDPDRSVFGAQPPSELYLQYRNEDCVREHADAQKQAEFDDREPEREVAPGGLDEGTHHHARGQRIGNLSKEPPNRGVDEVAGVAERWVPEQQFCGDHR